MESLGLIMRKVSESFFKGKKVFLTGHTGFKGSWATFWLNKMGANVTGYSLNPPTDPNLFTILNLKNKIDSIYGDVRDLNNLKDAMKGAEITIHMAAQPIVRESYKDPIETYTTNVIGTVNFLEAARATKSIKAIVNVTTDKCYENKERMEPYKEEEPMGGFDPYSSSKACSELVTQSYRNSFFNGGMDIGVATARAGNVIGGGDFASDRLLPDAMRAVLKKEKIIVRNPDSIRPWQHVLETISGYLLLTESLYNFPKEFSSAWNFGPSDSEAKTAEIITKTFCKYYGKEAEYEIRKEKNAPHEASFLRLDSTKAMTKLDWKPRWSTLEAVKRVVEWVKSYEKKDETIEKIMNKQIEEYYG